MFAKDDPTIVDYRVLQERFGGNAIVILIYPDSDLMSSGGIERSQRISQLVREIPGVDGVLSPSILNDAVEKIRPAGFFAPANAPPGLARPNDLVAKGIDRLFAGYTHSENYELVAVVAMLDPKHSPSTIVKLKQLAVELPRHMASIKDSAELIGEPVLIHDGFQLVERDGRKLATATLALLSVVVLLTLLDLRFVLLTGFVVVWSIVTSEAITVLLNMNRSLVSTIMTAIVTVIAVAAVLHLGVKFQDARFKGFSRVDATRRSLLTLSVPIFWTCMTDAAGFAALAWSRILPVKQFGIMIAIASIAVFIAILLFSAAAMMMPDLRFGKSLYRLQRLATQKLSHRCAEVSLFCVNHRRVCVVLALFLLGASVWGTARTRSETSFLNNFRPDSSIVRAYDKVEAQFGGAGVWDVILRAPDSFTSDYLSHVRELESELRQIEVDGTRLSKVISMADAELIVGQAPLMKLAPVSIRLSGMQMTMPYFVNAMLTADKQSPTLLRIMLRSNEQLPAETKTALIQEVDRVVRQFTASEAFRTTFLSEGDIESSGDDRDYRVTGYYVMMSRLIAGLIQDQWRCLAVAGILVFLLLCAATRSVFLSFAALLPNLLPAFIVLALAGWTGGKINMGATMIAAVSIGLSIDGSVHFLSSYCRTRHRGHAAERSIAHAAANVGVPILLATVALVVGFSVLSSSEFIPTATFGTLVAATLFLGTVINLTILPACVAVVEANALRHRL